MRNAATHTRACAHLATKTQLNRLNRRAHKAAVVRNEERAFAIRCEKILEYRRMVDLCESFGFDPDQAIDMSKFDSRSIVVLQRSKISKGDNVTTFKTTMDEESQKRRDYLAAIGRALPDDDDQQSFGIQEQFSEVMAWVFGTAIVLAIIGLVAFSVGMTKP